MLDNESLAFEVRLAEEEEPEGGAPPELVTDVALDDVVEGRLDPKVKDLISRIVAGIEPMPRALKPWEVAKFESQHVNITLLRAAGMKPGEIARVLGLSLPHVSITLHHPYARKLLVALAPANATRVLDIRTKMEVYASNLLDKMFELSDKSEDLEQISKVGFGLLDRVGHGPVQKSINASVPPSAFGEDGGSGNKHVLNRLAGALEESNRLNKEIMPGWRPQRPPDEGALPADSEVGFGGGPGQPHEAESVVPSSPPISSAEAAD